uniref:CD302 molecule n=1 Tax=Ovis aries TaxID=9940 RepID=A0AC11BZY6_SHEEP
MPRAAPPALLLPLLGLAAAAAADCPSSTWVQFQDSCYIFLQEAIKVESIEDVRNQCTNHGADMISIHNEEENAFILDTLKKQWKDPADILLGMFFDTDDASFKWFDNSNMTFNKWSDQEDGEELVDTCAFLHTKTGDWKKGNCEVSSVEGTLCKAATSGSFQMSQLFTSGGQNIGVSASASVLLMNPQDCSPLGWTGWISLQSKGLSRVFSNTTVQNHSSMLSFIVQLSHPYMTTGKTIALTRRTFVDKVMSLLLNMLSRLVITFLPRSKRLLISWLQSPLQ